MATILIVNSENKLIEYEVVASAADYRKPEDLALDRYTEEVLGFEDKLAVSKQLYMQLSLEIKNINVKLSLINHLCTAEADKITKLYNGQCAYVPSV